MWGTSTFASWEIAFPFFPPFLASLASIAFIFHGRSPLSIHPLLLSSNLRPFSFSAVFGKDSCVSLVINKTQRRSRKYLRREKRNRRKKTPPQRGGSYVSVFRYLSSGRQGGDLESGWIINRDLWFDLGAIRLSRWSLLDGRGKPRGRIEDS